MNAYLAGNKIQADEEEEKRNFILSQIPIFFSPTEYVVAEPVVHEDSISFSYKDINDDSDCGNLFVFYKQTHGNKIYLDSLKKCGSNSGTKNLTTIIEFATSLPFIDYITLEDHSKIQICKEPNLEISLKLLDLLSYGESWYNKFGFYSKNYSNEQVNNGKIVELKFLDALKKFVHPGTLDNLITDKDETSVKQNGRRATVINKILGKVAYIAGSSSSEVKDFQVKTVFQLIKQFFIQNINRCETNSAKENALLKSVVVFVNGLMQIFPVKYNMSLTKSINRLGSNDNNDENESASSSKKFKMGGKKKTIRKRKKKAKTRRRNTNKRRK